MASTDWERLKEKGNEEFRKKDYTTAIALYTEALNINPNEETLWGNRSQCYKALGKLKQAKFDLQKALEINPKNIKNIKRLATIQTMTGNFGEAEQLYQRCVNLEPRDLSHSRDLNKIRNLIKDWETLKDNFDKENYTKCEEICNKMIVECSHCLELKKMFIHSLLNNVKLKEALNFINNLTSDDRMDDEIQYYLILTYYYDGQ